MDLPFTQLASYVDQAAVEGCLKSGMIVIVEVNALSFIEGIISAHTSVEQAFAAYQPVEMYNNTAVIIPGEKGPTMFYCWMTKEEMRNAANA